MLNIFKNLRNEKGQGMVEYALALALVAVVVTVALTNVGDKAKTIFERVDTTLGNILTSNP